MSPGKTWRALHDATLDALELDWATGEIVLRIRTGSAEQPKLSLVASSACRLVCDRKLPWGASSSINEIRGHAPTADNGVAWMEVEMQTGDVIRIEASEFQLRAEG